jgi:hypothetical protein
MAHRVNEPANGQDNEQLDPNARELSERRKFLCSLGKWSTAAIAAILLTESPTSAQAPACVNRPGSRINGPRAAGWANRGGSWTNGVGSRLESGSNAIDRGRSWVNSGGRWINRGSEGWLNSRGGGGSWVNRRGW